MKNLIIPAVITTVILLVAWFYAQHRREWRSTRQYVLTNIKRNHVELLMKLDAANPCSCCELVLSMTKKYGFTKDELGVDRHTLMGKAILNAKLNVHDAERTLRQAVSKVDDLRWSNPDESVEAWSVKVKKAFLEEDSARLKLSKQTDDLEKLIASWEKEPNPKQANPGLIGDVTSVITEVRKLAS